MLARNNLDCFVGKIRLQIWKCYMNLIKLIIKQCIINKNPVSSSYDFFPCGKGKNSITIRHPGKSPFRDKVLVVQLTTHRVVLQTLVGPECGDQRSQLSGTTFWEICWENYPLLVKSSVSCVSNSENGKWILPSALSRSVTTTTLKTLWGFPGHPRVRQKLSFGYQQDDGMKSFMIMLFLSRL